MKTFITNKKNEAWYIKLLKTLIAALFWLGIWQGISLLVSKNILLPSPTDTAGALIKLASEKEFYISCLMTFLRILTGFFLGVITGTVFGWITYRIDTVSLLLTPLKTTIKATPVASFIILALVWLDKNSIPIFISMLIVTPIMWSSVESSLKSIDVKYYEAAEIFRLPFIKKLRYIIIPFIKKNYLGALETCFGIAWKSGVAAEVLCLPVNSIGKELYNSKIYLETDKMFAWTVCIIIISLLCELIIKKLLNNGEPERRIKGKVYETNDKFADKSFRR